MKFNNQEIAILIAGVQSKKKSWDDIATQIEEELNIKRTIESLRSKYKLLRKEDPSLPPMRDNSQNSISVIVEPEEKVPFSVDANNIVTWKYKHGVIELKLEELDEIFYEYSKKGLNMSQVKIQNKYGLTAIQWQSLKRTFDLVKDSDVFSPYSLSLVSGKEACEMIEMKIKSKYEPKNMRAVVEYAEEKHRKIAYEKAIKHVSTLDYRRQIFESELLDYIASAKEKVVVTKTNEFKKPPLAITIQDLHVGANIEATKNLPKFDAEVVRLRLDETAKEINAMNSSSVTIAFNGDIIETFTGLNHINSWKNIDKAYGYGVQATIKAIELITEFLQRVHNVHEVLLIAGNHDRTTSNNNEDVTGEVIQWIHYVLNAKFGNVFPVAWSSDVIQREIDGVSYIWTHGHLALSKRPVAEIVNMHGNPMLFNIVIEGHLHTRKIKADTSRYRHVVGSSFFTGNDYSANLGFSTMPGFLVMFAKNGKPVVIDIPLN